MGQLRIEKVKLMYRLEQMGEIGLRIFGLRKHQK
jgi:hypothetical protein